MKQYKIYPSIGCARVGNGPAEKDQVIFSPDVPWKHMNDTTVEYLTVDGRLKKQAQRFRIYECDENGIPTEQIKIGGEIKSVEWHADVANKKAAWYDFNNSMDLSVLQSNGNISPEVAKAKLAPGISAKLRNPNVLNEMRDQLVVKPGKRTVNAVQTKVDLEDTFPSSPINSMPVFAAARNVGVANVKLGTIEYDEDGTLIFYGGDGISASLNPSDLNDDFADNSNWHDDICDGKITATITLEDDTVIEIENADSAAWIATAPPDYAPQIEPLSTMYDMITGAAYTTEEVEALSTTTFSEVFPILWRLYRMQWVNQGDLLEYSLKYMLDNMDISLLLSNDNEPGSPAYIARHNVFARFRNPNYTEEENRIIPSRDTTSRLIAPNHGLPKIPYYPGDGIDYPGSPMQWFAIPPILFKKLTLWTNGDFTVDEEVSKLTDLESIAEYYQTHGFGEAANPALLSSRAVMETMYGGGFHPGVEITWPMRHSAMYQINKSIGGVNDKINLGGVREFRINADENGSNAGHFYSNFGHLMTPDDIARSLTNDNYTDDWLWHTTPGDLTKWMGIPWQSDAASCQAVYTPEDFPIPVWWPANLPVHIIPEDNYDYFKTGDDRTDEMRRYLFASRQDWLQTADTGFVGYHAEGGYTNGLIQMVYQWKNMGVVSARTVEDPISGIPAVSFVALNGPRTEDHSTKTHECSEEEVLVSVTGEENTEE